MATGDMQPTGPDLTKGVDEAQIRDGIPLLGHVAGTPVIVVRQGTKLFAVGAACTHWNGPLALGLVRDGEIRCPWHHARFDLATGLAVGAPALNPVACYSVRRTGGRVRVGARKAAPIAKPSPPINPSSVVIVGAGAAGAAAAETLRHEGYGGPIALIGEDLSDPVDRPNLSKDYLAGVASEEWIPLRDDRFYHEIGVDLIRGPRATGLDLAGKSVRLSDGRGIPYGVLILATGAEPVRLAIPGSDLAHVRTLRTLGDSQDIIARANQLWPAVVIGASFIGLEVAAALRARGVEVTVVAPEPEPLVRVLGQEVGSFLRRVHQVKGVQFQLGRKPERIEADHVILDDGAKVDAGLVVMGVGVRPRVELALQSGLAVDRGILVSEFLRTSNPDVYAVGDVARYPDKGRLVRIEHWVVAERQGQAVARIVVGRGRPFRDVPFFWSTHYDLTVSYVGHAERVEHTEIKGSLEEGSTFIAYREGGRITAVATLNRDQALLEAEEALGLDDEEELERILARQ